MEKLAGGGPPLPEDLVFCEILTCLPAKPLLRCHAVCHSWRRRLTSDTKLLLDHHRRQPSLPLVIFGNRSTEERRIDALDHRTGERRPVARTTGRILISEVARILSKEGHLEVVASCDGLLILRANGWLQICNPATRQRAPLTLLHGAAFIAALYRHRASGSYRVLCSFMRPEDGHALGSSELRCVGEPPAPWVSGELAMVMPLLSSCYPPVLAEGTIYWESIKLFPGEGNGNNMLVFDTMAESFEHLLTPVLGAPFEMSNGAFGLYCNNGGTVDIWKLQDHKSWTWSFNNRIKLPENVVSVIPVLDTTEGEVLVLSDREEPGLQCKHLQHISGANGSLLARYEWNAPCIQRHRLRESLVRHDFFSMEENVGGVDEKPLFDGLTTVALLRDDNSEPN